MEWITVAIPALLKILGFFIQRSQLNNEIKQDFINFVKKYEERKADSARIHDSEAEQFEEIKKLKS